MYVYTRCSVRLCVSTCMQRRANRSRSASTCVAYSVAENKHAHISACGAPTATCVVLGLSWLCARLWVDSASSSGEWSCWLKRARTVLNPCMYACMHTYMDACVYMHAYTQTVRPA